MDYNITAYKIAIHIVSDSIWQLTFMKVITYQILVLYPKGYHNYLKTLLNVPSFSKHISARGQVFFKHKKQRISTD